MRLFVWWLPTMQTLRASVTWEAECSRIGGVQMDLVVGLSLTPTAVRWVLVEGATGEGAPIDRGEFLVGGLDADFMLDVLLNREVVAENRVHAVGVTWSNEAAVSAAAVLDALADRGVRNVVVVPDTEAAGALAFGIAEITDYDDVAVCVVEPDVALVALVKAGDVRVDRIDRPLDHDDALELTKGVIALLDSTDRTPNAVFVVGSDDVDVIVSSFEEISDAQVISAAEADLALARGAALASARELNDVEVPVAWVAPGVTSRVGVLSAVLCAAVLTFIVSLSVAVGLRPTPDSAMEQPQNVNAAAPAAPSTPRPAPSLRQAAAAMAQTIVVAKPPAPKPEAAPVYQPPAAAPVEPPPVYQPPAAPAPVYVPPPAYVPAQPPPQPRLRDRIIERIPIINRFHEPQYPQ
jgi:hypothetical protein